MAESQALTPSIALAAYAEPLCDGRRVLVFGNALSDFAEQLMGRGARLVHICDPDLLRVAEASARNTSRQVSVSQLTDGNLALRDAAFDLVIVENLAAGDAVSLVRKARRALAARGVAMFVCPNPDATLPLLSTATETTTSPLDYYALYDAVSAEFPNVRMLGQTPFVGYAIVDFAPKGDPEPALDNGFVPGGAEEPDLYIAVAAEHVVTLEEFSVIQLPWRELAEFSHAPLASSKRDALEVETRALESAAEREPQAARREETSSAAERERELERQNAWIAELESRATIADERADQAQHELEEVRERAKHELDAAKQQAKSEVERAKLQLSELTRELEAVRSSLAEQQKASALLQVELEERDARILAHEAALKEQGARIEKLLEIEHDPRADVVALEQQLVDRAAEIRRLQRDLREAERVGKELLRELTRARMAAQVATVSHSTAKLEELAQLLAEKEADLTASAWTIDALYTRLEALGARSGNEDLSGSDVQRTSVLLSQLAAERAAAKEVR